MENIVVAVRVRPLLKTEINNAIKYVHEEGEPPVLMVCDKRNIYGFDNVFSNEVHQCEVYNVIVQPLVHKVLDGYNSTILAYGQTGTGKTYTMGTDSEKYNDTDSGLIPRALDEFFEVSIRDSDVSISVSFIEIYNEKVYDLLQPSKTALAVKGFCVNGMTCVRVEHNEEARRWLLIGGKGRHVRHTALNASSSRSHAIFTIYCTRNDSGITSKLHLVDLAGSESVRRTGNQGEAFHEGVRINRGLLAVGRVISALSDKRTSVIPYRDSTLTTILHDSLSTNNYVSLLACISPSENDVSETLATLRFAVKARAVKSRPQLESIVTEFDKANPGILGKIEPEHITTTVKKKRKLPAMIISKQVRRPLFGNTNASMQSVDTRSERFTSSPNFASTLDSLSISSSTTIENHKETLNISPIVKKCTEALQNTVLNHVNTIIQEKISATPLLYTESSNKENTSPPMIVHWSTVENRMIEIIRKELVEMAANGTISNNMNQTSNSVNRKNLSPLDSDFKQQNGECLSEKFEGNGPHLFKLPAPVHQTVRRLKESENTRKSVQGGSSPIIPVRRSTRLSLKMCETSFMPTPAPRSKILNTMNLIKSGSTSSYFSSPVKQIRKSIRLKKSIIRFSPYLREKEQDSSLEEVFQPIPTPRSIIVRKNEASKKRTESITKKIDLKWITPKKILNNPKKKHRFRTLRVLNTGLQKQVECLATVGPKTASQIITYRTLNGEFREFKDLKKIPTWGEKKFNNFMLANQLI